MTETEKSAMLFIEVGGILMTVWCGRFHSRVDCKVSFVYAGFSGVVSFTVLRKIVLNVLVEQVMCSI